MDAEPCREQAPWGERVVGSRAWILAFWRVETVASFDSCVCVQVKTAMGDWGKGKEVGGGWGGGGRGGQREVLGEDGQSSCDMLCETVALSLKVRCKTKFKTLWANRGIEWAWWEQDRVTTHSLC